MPRYASNADRNVILRAVQDAITTLVSLGYSVSADLHPGERFNQLHREEPAAAMEEMKGAWRELAQIMRRHPADRVFAEVIAHLGLVEDSGGVGFHSGECCYHDDRPQKTMVCPTSSS